MTPTERQITTRIIKELNNIDGVYMRKTHGGAYGGAGWPDIVGVAMNSVGLGVFVALEVKRPDTRYKVTPLQLREINRYRECGGVAHVVTSVEQSLEIVKDIATWE